MTGRTFGELEFVAMQHRDGGRFSLRLEPDVMIRAKRMFPRSDAQASGVLHMLDTPEVAADIVWLTQRFPLAMDDAARARLEARHGQYVERMTTVAEILNGDRKLDWPKKPAVEPRDYQLKAADLAATTRGLLIGDEVGLGKTFGREWGGQVVRDPVALGQHLRTEGLLIRRTRREVGRELPKPVEEIVEVDSNSDAIDEVVRDAARLADRLLNAPDRTDRFTASGQFDMKMRQATGIDKAPFVAGFVDALLESERKVVLYGWHRTVYDIWLDKLKHHHPVMYTGSESPAGKDAAVRRFLDDPRCRVFICSLRSGAALDDLQKVANACVFGELDWSPAMHHQAIGRLARDGQDHTVAAFYALSTEGSDPFIRDVLEAKTQQAEGIVAATDTERLFSAVDGKGDRIRQMAEAVLAQVGRQDPDDYYGGLPLEEAY